MTAKEPLEIDCAVHEQNCAFGVHAAPPLPADRVGGAPGVLRYYRGVVGLAAADLCRRHVSAARTDPPAPVAVRRSCGGGQSLARGRPEMCSVRGAGARGADGRTRRPGRGGGTGPARGVSQPAMDRSRHQRRVGVDTVQCRRYIIAIAAI